MRVGLFMMPLHGLGRDLGATLGEDREAIILADQLGFEEAWVGEHFAASPEPIVSPLMFLATLVHHTKQIKLGTGVLALPHHHPAVIAGQCGLFDHLSGGRFLMGIGPGGLSADMEMFKTLGSEDRGHMMIESIEMIHAIWAGQPPWSLKGRFWDISIAKSVVPELGVGQMLKPLQQPHPPVSLSVLGLYTGMATLAGERGWRPISANFIPACNAATHWTAYAAGCATAGRAADPAAWSVARSILVTETDAEAEAYLARPDCGLRFYFNYLRAQLIAAGQARVLKPADDTPDAEVTVDYLLDTVVVAGSPDTVLAKLAAAREELGPFGTLLLAGHDWDDKPLWQRSIRLFADAVRPRL